MARAQGTRARTGRAARGRRRFALARRAALARDRQDPFRTLPAAHAKDESSLADLAESIRAQGVVQPILVRPDRRRTLRDHRRRATLARCRTRGIEGDSRAGPRRSRPGRARARADRKHPARGSRIRSRKRRARAADRGVRSHARSRGTRGRPFAQRGDESAAAHAARQTGAGLPARGQDRHGSCAGAARSARFAAGRGGCDESSRRGCRFATRNAWRSLRRVRPRGGENQRVGKRPMVTFGASRTSWPTRSAPRCASRARAEGAGRIVIGYATLSSSTDSWRSSSDEIGRDRLTTKTAPAGAVFL